MFEPKNVALQSTESDVSTSGRVLRPSVFGLLDLFGEVPTVAVLAQIHAPAKGSIGFSA